MYFPPAWWCNLCLTRGQFGSSSQTPATHFHETLHQWETYFEVILICPSLFNSLYLCHSLSFFKMYFIPVSLFHGNSAHNFGSRRSTLVSEISTISQSTINVQGVPKKGPNRKFEGYVQKPDLWGKAAKSGLKWPKMAQTSQKILCMDQSGPNIWAPNIALNFFSTPFWHTSFN